METYKKAVESEIGWINERYDEVQFVHSNFENEIIAIAEINGEKAGLGRLVRIDPTCFELGGIYTLERFRGQKVAAKIVAFLLASAPQQHTIYCIPFTKLTRFYQDFGFLPCPPDTHIPDPLLKKFKWCEKQYDDAVALLVLKASASSY